MGATLPRILLGAVLALPGLGIVRAHIPEQLVVELELREGTWAATSEMDVKFAVVALMHHYIPPDTGSGWIENLHPGQIGLVKEVTEKLYRERLHLSVDGERLPMEIEFPDYEKAPVSFALGENDEPVVKVVMSGKMPAGPLTAEWKARWGPSLVLLVERSGGQEVPVVYRVGLGEKTEVARGGESAGDSDRVSARPARWLAIGFAHLIPNGPLHLLFLLGLFLLVPKRGPVLTQAACFTAAHSVSLWVVVLGLVPVPAGIVVPFLAVGLVYIGIENLFLRTATPWRLGVVSGLGLVHGVGLANALRALLAPGAELTVPLAGFHLGVELAQVAFFVLLTLVSLPVLRRECFAKIRTLGSVSIAAVGLFWAVDFLVL